jgi:hypothetical protein
MGRLVQGYVGAAWESVCRAMGDGESDLQPKHGFQSLGRSFLGERMDLKLDSNIELIIIPRISEMDFFNFAHL